MSRGRVVVESDESEEAAPLARGPSGRLQGRRNTIAVDDEDSAPGSTASVDNVSDGDSDGGVSRVPLPTPRAR